MPRVSFSSAPMAGNRPLIYLVAGEPSGDRRGARLIAALRAATGDNVRFRGVGGEMMDGEGLPSRFPKTPSQVSLPSNCWT